MSSISANNSDDNLQLLSGQNNEDEVPKPRVKRRIQQFSDSDSEKEGTNDGNNKLGSEETVKTPQNSDTDSDAVIFRSIPQKSRKARDGSLESTSDLDQTVRNSESKDESKHADSIDGTVFHKSTMKKVSTCSSSDSDQTVKFNQQARIKNKRNKMKDKFRNLINSRGKEPLSAGSVMESTKSSDSTEDSDNNVEDSSSIAKIKQKIKERMSYKPSICDPDTSDEENKSNQHKSMPKLKKERRIKLTSPKPQRMSAKQAMENMQKIKSESNRMLREKEVSLPYHRPKALSLKDIMSRRKPAMSSDGKCLPIKMNGDQLKHYAQMLEDRQKQMMELWQSDTDEENDDKKSDDENPDKKTEAKTAVDDSKEIESTVIENLDAVNPEISAEDSDKLFDVLSCSIIEDINTSKSKLNKSNQDIDLINKDIVSEEQDSVTNMKLVFNDSETSITEEKHDDTDCIIEEVTIENAKANLNEAVINNEHQVSEIVKPNIESESQLISLHYDSEKLDICTENLQTGQNEITELETEKSGEDIENIDKEIETMDVDNGFSDDDMNIDDIDNIIENAEIIKGIEDKLNSQILIRDRPLHLKPKLTGSPGMVIDLEDSDTLPKKSGVQLLKERFTFFAKLKTTEELERDNDRKIKPGNQHLKLKQKLEGEMAEQRSLEWAKRLEHEKQLHNEMKELRGEESDDENDIDKIEAKLEGLEENVADQSESEDEDELLENDVEIRDKPRPKNPMLENEAEESDCDENDAVLQQNENDKNKQDDADINEGDEYEVEAESSDESESSESEEEQHTTKKGRILKAFEDSDDEEITKVEEINVKSVGSVDLLSSQPISQDEVLTLAQRHKSVSEDLFTSQGSSLLASQKMKSARESLENDTDLGTQTFSILDSTNNATDLLNSSDKLNLICETQPYDENLDTFPAMCSGSFSQSLPPLPITQVSQSQPIGEDIVALCTGKFYENEFISQVNDDIQTPLGASQDDDSDSDSQTVDKGDDIESVAKSKDVLETERNNELNDEIMDTVNKENATSVIGVDIHGTENKDTGRKVDDNLKSILDELDDPEFDLPKPNKFFCGVTQKETESREQEIVKKKFIIDSDDDTNDASITQKKKKLKKKKLEKRALQISDDEEEEVTDLEEAEEYDSEIEKEDEDRLVEYDSEENEIESKPQNQKLSKKKRKGTEFFEQEAELTSEDEWAGSGDEDEAGLDRMEREAGDDESFHQGRLQRELGQIHMRDVLDQDKREVRIIQELLFEDGDLGAGGRQRKFKWKNLDGDEEVGEGENEFKDTQEEEFESEEQWRKQRHERETFLRQMQNNGDTDDSLNVSINRTTIIKANLMSKTMSMLLEEHQPNPKSTDCPVEPEKKKDIPSPKKTYSILQQSYQGSILNRGKGALARLAALATPLAVDDDAPKGKSAASGSRRNFVFATLTPEAPKVMKRKAVTTPGTPALVKKMKTEEKQNMSKSSLLDRMKV